MPFGYKPLFNDENYQFIFGKFIRYERTNQNLSLNELAKIVGIDASYLSAIENGKKCPSEITAYSLIEALDVTFNFDTNIKPKHISKFQHYFEALLNNSHNAYDLLQDLVKYKQSFLYPYVLIAEYVYDKIKHTHQSNVNIEQLNEFYDHCDESLKTIVDNFDILDHYSSSQPKHITTMYITKLTNKTSDPNTLMFTDLPMALIHLNAATFFNDHKDIIKSIHSCEKAQTIFQRHINITGLFAVKELNAKNMVLAHDYSGAIAEYLDFAHHPLVAKNPSVIAQCYENIGAIYYETNDYPQSINYLNSAIKHDNQCKNARYYLALCYYQLHDNKLVDIIESFKSFDDAKNLHMLEFILSLTTKDDQKITHIYQKIVNDISFVNQIEIIEKLLFDYYTKIKKFEKANEHAIKLIQLMA